MHVNFALLVCKRSLYFLYLVADLKTNFFRVIKNIPRSHSLNSVKNGHCILHVYPHGSVCVANLVLWPTSYKFPDKEIALTERRVGIPSSQK